ncbi:hypothetical protein KFK09_019113 [Dendrobium nobile]|uniref:Uncharacterized protein n=1 Tax=Dendrobium nobile TaxID=94219 RepID=A0A8T3B326_DENNO|nr:hypothetical protein KFK09_019113 [Dendrobium nobile]
MSLPSRRAPDATSDPTGTTSEGRKFRFFQNSTSRDAEQQRITNPRQEMASEFEALLHQGVRTYPAARVYSFLFCI